MFAIKVVFAVDRVSEQFIIGYLNTVAHEPNIKFEFEVLLRT